MKLIAFDIEACNRYVPGSIFSIGIAEADSSFNINNKYNILINPETKFVMKFRKPIDFKIDEKSLKNELNFVDSYNTLKNIFNQNAIYIAHSISNDLRMLNFACKRNKKPSFHFNFLCSQMLYSIYANSVNGIGLDNAAELMDASFTHHRSDEDALMSLKLVEYICSKNKCSIDELVGLYGIKYGTLNNFEVKLMESTVYDEQKAVRKLERLKEKEQASNAQNIIEDK